MRRGELAVVSGFVVASFCKVEDYRKTGGPLLKTVKMAAKLADSDMNELKGNVLIERMEYLSSELGDPARYFPALRAKGVLFPEDCEKIKAKVTASEKVRQNPFIRRLLPYSLRGGV